MARYYSSTQGRFTSPDEFTGGPDHLYSFVDDASANPTFYADLTNPQSLNKYTYCVNNPLRFVDPDGHDGLVETLNTAANQTRGVPVVGPVVQVVAGAAAAAVIAVEVGPVLADGNAKYGRKNPSCPAISDGCAMQGDSVLFNKNNFEGVQGGAKATPPNPNGSPGAPDHQKEVKKQAKKARAEAKPGETVQENKKIKGVDSTRRPDVQVVGPNGKVVKVVEVERRPNSRRNRNREKEYNRLHVPNKTVPIPKHRN